MGGDKSGASNINPGVATKIQDRGTGGSNLCCTV